MPNIGQAKVFHHVIAASQTTGVKDYLIANKPIRLLNVVAWATGTEATQCVVKIQSQTAPGVTSGATDLATLTFGAVDNQGKQLNYDFNGVEVVQGDAVVINVTTGSTANKGIVVDIFYQEAEAMLENLGQAAA